MIPTVAAAISTPKMTAMVPTMMAKTKMSGKQSVRPSQVGSAKVHLSLSCTETSYFIHTPSRWQPVHF